MRWLLAAGIVAMGVTLSTRSAHACSYIASIYLGQPEDGASDVPTNVVPWLVGTPLDQPVRITLRDASGAEVPADVVRMRGYRHAEYFEVTPESALAPYARYTLTTEIESIGHTEGTGTFSFTTGGGPLDEPPADLGELDLQIADNSAAGSSCEDHVFACVATPPDTVLRATVTAGTEIEAELITRWPGPLFARRDSPITSPFCVEVRARNLAGVLGPLSRVCSESVPTYDILTTHPVTCDGARVLTDDGYADQIGKPMGAAAGGGCAATPARAGPTWALLALALLARHRPRRA